MKRNLGSSSVLDLLPLTDPYLLMQSVFAGHEPERRALIGAAIMLGSFFLVGGRVYCTWVCPVNPLTDLAAWLRRRLGITRSVRISRSIRYWLLAATLALAAVTGTIAWEELVNPVSMLHRGLIFGIGTGWIIVLAVVLFDLLFAARGTSPVILAPECTNCGRCIDVCPRKVFRFGLRWEGERRAGPRPSCFRSMYESPD